MPSLGLSRGEIVRTSHVLEFDLAGVYVRCPHVVQFDLVPLYVRTAHVFQFDLGGWCPVLGGGGMAWGGMPTEGG